LGYAEPAAAYKRLRGRLSNRKANCVPQLAAENRTDSEGRDAARKFPKVVVPGASLTLFKSAAAR